MRDIRLTPVQILQAIVGLLFLLLPAILNTAFELEFLIIVIQPPGSYIYIAVVIVLFSFIHKIFPSGVVKMEQAFERSPLILYMFIGSVGVIILGLYLYNIVI